MITVLAVIKNNIADASNVNFIYLAFQYEFTPPLPPHAPLSP